MTSRKTTSRNKNRENVVVWLSRGYDDKFGKYLPEIRTLSTSEWREKELGNTKTSSHELFNQEVDYWSRYSGKDRDVFLASYVMPYQKDKAHKKAHLHAYKEKQSGKYLSNLHPDPYRVYNPKEDFSYDPEYRYALDSYLADYAMRNRRRDNRGKPPLLRRGLTYRTTGRSKRR